MGEFERLVKFFKCEWCQSEWQANPLDPSYKPKACRICHRHNWFTGESKAWSRKATIVKPIGRSGRKIVIQKSGKAVLKLVKAAAAEVDRNSL